MARMPSVFNLRPIRGARLPQVTIEMTKPVLPPVKEPEPEVVVETPPPAAVEPEVLVTVEEPELPVVAEVTQPLPVVTLEVIEPAEVELVRLLQDAPTKAELLAMNKTNLIKKATEVSLEIPVGVKKEELLASLIEHFKLA